jgi:hypothetical protein
VDVLEAATSVVGDFEAEEFFEEFVPRGGEVANGEITFKQLGFQFKAEKDVEIVSDLVGFDAMKERSTALEARQQSSWLWRDRSGKA